MKKLIVVFSEFFLISIIIYCAVIIGIYKSNTKLLSANIPNKEQRRYSFTARKLEEFRIVKKTDVLIFGSSLAIRNYDPKVFYNNNLQSFTLGTSSQKPNMTQVFVEHYLKNVNADLVIIDVNPYLMLVPDTFETVNVIMNSRKNSSDWDLFMAEPNLMAFNALIIKYTGFAENDRLNQLTDSISDKKDKYLKGGFVTNNIIYKNEDKSPVIKINSFEPLDNQVQAFADMIEFLKSRKINYILVLSPVNEDYFINKSKINTEQFKKLGRTYFSKYGNYFDSNDLAKYDKTDFMDFSHLNENGAKKFTNALMPVLKSKMQK